MRNKHLDAAHLLIKAGADYLLSSADGYSALFGAVENDDLELVRQILTDPRCDKTTLLKTTSQTIENIHWAADIFVTGDESDESFIWGEKRVLERALILGRSQEMVKLLLDYDYSGVNIDSLLECALASGSLDVALLVYKKFEQEAPEAEDIIKNKIFKRAIQLEKISEVQGMISMPEIKEYLKNVFKDLPDFIPEDSELTQVLFTHGADPSLQDENSSTAFHRGINVLISKELFQQMISSIPENTRKTFLNAPNQRTGKKPLTEAIQTNRLDCVELLMVAGAELDYSGIAAALDFPEILQYVLDNTAIEKRQELLTKRLSRSPSVFQMAAASGKKEIVEQLRKAQADCILQITSDNQTEPLEIPVNRSWLAEQSSFFQALFKSGFKESQQEKIEIRENHSEILKQLLEFPYTGKLKIHHNNFEEMLQLTDQYALQAAYPLIKNWQKRHPECKFPKGQKRPYPDDDSTSSRKKFKTENS